MGRERGNKLFSIQERLCTSIGVVHVHRSGGDSFQHTALCNKSREMREIEVEDGGRGKREGSNLMLGRG